MLWWEFYLPDEDRSTGWDNHCYVLQLVCTGFGATPDLAWSQAVASGAVPEGYVVEDPPSIAIRRDHKLKVDLR